MSLTAALGSDGNGATFTWRGRQYTLMPIDIAKEQAFEDWMKARGRREVCALKDMLDPEDFRAAVAEFAAAAATKFAFWGEECGKARKTPAGTIKMLQLMLSTKHPKVGEQTVMEMLAEEGEQINLAVQDFFRKGSADKKPDPTPTTELDMLPEPGAA